MRFDTDDLSAFQTDFLRAVTTAEPAGSAALRVYQDTYFWGLLDILRDTFAATLKALGDEGFNAFARDYIRSHPLQGGDRNRYGDAFSDFLTVHPQLDVSWLPDLAAYEWSLHLAHHAADATPCDFEALLDPQMRIALHPSVRILSLTHDIAPVHAALVADEALPKITPIICDLLIGRDRDDAVIRLCLAPLEVEFIGLTALGGSLFTTLEQLSPTDDDMILLQTLLARLVQHGLLTSQETPKESPKETP